MEDDGEDKGKNWIMFKSNLVTIGTLFDVFRIFTKRDVNNFLP